ncbi:MAG: NAD(P)/FAD-dependent oxidoreductase [Candidatus Micrarchaeota archaeon]
MEKHAIVIGASAVGSITAKELVKRGIEVDLLEEDSRVGKFGKCGGIFSKHGMDFTGVNYADLILNEIRGARIIAGKEELKVKSSAVQAVVLPRQSFDERAADEAVAAGANLHLNTRVRGFEVNQKINVQTTDDGAFSSNVIIGCDGNASLTARKLGFPPIKLSDCVICYQAEYSKADVPEKDIVDLILDQSHYRNFFAWTIPISDERIRIGVATTEINKIENAKRAALENPYLANIIKGSHKTFEFHHMIPLRYRKHTQKRFGNSYALLVGDAAGQVKATSGGGVNFGAKCAKVAAKGTAEYLIEGKELDYESAWQLQHGETLKLHYLLHRLYRLMPNWLSELGVGVGRRIGMGKLLEKYGDMDYVFKI